MHVFALLCGIIFTMSCILARGYVKSHNPGVFPMRLTAVDDLFDTLKTGDIIFTKASNRKSVVQQFMFGSFVNHCAMIVRFDSALWVWDVNPYVGAYMAPLLDFVHHNWLGRAPPPSDPPLGLGVPYVFPRTHSPAQPDTQSKSQLFIRRLNRALDQDAVVRFLQRNIGRPYSYRFWMSAFEKATGNVVPLPLPWALNRDAVGMFCSEIIAHTWAAAGALDTRRTAPESVLPHDFWINRIALRDGLTLLPPERIYGDIDALVQPNARLIPRVRPSDWLAYHIDDPVRMWIRGAVPDVTTQMAAKISEIIGSGAR